MSNIFGYHETIKACVLTDVINWKTIEKSYEDLCERFGNDALPMTSHQKLFNKFTREIQKMAEAQININEIIFNESMYLRYRILRDVISKVPIDKSYVKLRETMGDIKYQDFEFWYYRFYNGQLNLGYDRSKDPKPLGFSDLPIDVVEKIVDKSNAKSRYNLRSVSRGLKSLVDSRLLVMEKITVVGNSICVNDVKMFIRNRVSDHLLTLIGNPKLQLGILDIDICCHFVVPRDIMPVDELFKSLNHQLHVRCLKIKSTCNEDFMDFIRCLKPKILKKIEIGWDKIKLIDIHGIIESEQWKQAEEVIIANPIICNFAHFFHFKSFDICLREVSTESMLQLRDGISKSSNFEWCRIRMQFILRPISWSSNEEIQRGLGLKKHGHNNMNYFVYTIPNSTESLIFYFFDRKIFIIKYKWTDDP